MLQVEVAVAKAAKYAVRESGDSVEVVERPHGGLSLVMADGQRSGRSAKAISNIVVRKAISLLAEGVRDGAAARAAHDYLRTQRSGQVSAELTILSIDLESHTLVVTRNSQCPVLVAEEQVDGALGWRSLDEESGPIGIRSRSRPVITELPLGAGQMVVAFTDGLLHAGIRRGANLDVVATLVGLCHPAARSAQALANGLLDAALRADELRPADDTSVVVCRITEEPQTEHPAVRRMTVSFPVPPA